MNTVEKILEYLKLKPHPEGGFFLESYRSEGIIKQRSLSGAYTGDRNFATCIYYLLTADTFSAFHKVVQDETWHFYDGTPLELHMITLMGYHVEVIMGRDLEFGQVMQFTVPGGTWFAARVKDHHSFSLMGCTVAPGFTFADFTLADRNELISLYPRHEKLIIELTRE